MALAICWCDAPIFIGNATEGIADCFSLQSEVLHALGFVAVILFFLVLPISAFASVKRKHVDDCPANYELQT